MKAISIPVPDFKPTAETVKKFQKQFASRVSALIKELGIAIGGMSKRNLLKIVGSIMLTAVKCTYRHKADIGKNLWESTLRGFIRTKEKLGEYKTKGVLSVFKSDCASVGKGTKRALNNARIAVSSFNDMSFSRKKAVLKDAVIYALFFVPSILIVGGGLDMEGGVPDLDMAAGNLIGKGSLGMHRHVFSHTVIAGLGIEVLVRAAVGGVREVYKYLPEKHDKIWDEVNRIIPSAESATVAGAWLGIALHFIKDSALFSGGYEARVKAYNGIPFSMADNMHQNMFGANGILAGSISLSKTANRI